MIDDTTLGETGVSLAGEIDVSAGDAPRLIAFSIGDMLNGVLADALSDSLMTRETGMAALTALDRPVESAAVR